MGFLRPRECSSSDCNFSIRSIVST